MVQRLFPAFQLEFLFKIIQNLFQIRTANLLQIIINPGIWFRNLYDPVQVNRSCYYYTVSICVVDGGFQVFQLLLAITHCR